MALESKDNARESVSAVEGSAQQPPALPDRYADESYKLFSKVQVLDPTPEEARRIRNKCLWRILPFICIGYHVMYVDKQTVCVVFFFFSFHLILKHNLSNEFSTARELCDPWYSGGRASQFDPVQLALLHLLLWLPAGRIPAELGASAVPGGQMAGREPGHLVGSRVIRFAMDK